MWINHGDVIKWKHFPHNWPFGRGIHRSRWIPHTKVSDAELWCFLWSASEKRLCKQSWGWWFETPSCSLWRQCNASRDKAVLLILSYCYYHLVSTLHYILLPDPYFHLQSHDGMSNIVKYHILVIPVLLPVTKSIYTLEHLSLEFASKQVQIRQKRYNFPRFLYDKLLSPL